MLGGGAVYVSSRLGTSPKSEVYAPDSNASAALPAPAAPLPGDGSGASFPSDGTAADRSDRSEPRAISERAAADPETMLAELSALSPPARQREVALAVLAALGNDDAALSRVAAMLPEADRLSFRIDALARRAESDPASALGSALALDVSAARRLAIPKIAEAAAGVVPSRALALASLIGGRDLKALYVASVAGAWAQRDARAALAYLEAAIPSELSAKAAAGALNVIAASDQELLLRSLDSLSPALRPAARRAAILALAERDSQSALAELESFGPGRDVVELEAAVAERYALENPAAAVEWAKTRSNPLSALEGALRGAASADYDTAVDLAMQVLETEPIWSAFALVESGAGDFSQVADRLLGSNVPDADEKFRALMIRWPQVDAEAALEWAQANAGRLESSWLQRLTLDGGREAPELAIAMLDRVAPDLRDDWIAGVAGGLGAADADRALAFLARHRGEPGYEQGLNNVVDSLTASDPPAAARLVERTGAGAAGRVAWGWAQHDPVAASTWVEGLEDAEMLRDGVANLALNWSRVDADAAMDWLLGLPDGRARDFGLQVSLQSATAATGSVDVRALDAIGDDQIREQAAMGALVVLGRSDPDGARRLVDEYIENPRMRREALRRIAALSGGTDTVDFFSSGIDVPR